MTEATRPPAVYRLLYSQGTAAALVLASGLLLAIGQTRTIVDAVAMVHPSWSPLWFWIVAIGFETAILGVGLVMAMTGDRTLWRWEVVLVGASIVAGLAVGLHGQTMDTWAAIGAAAVRALAVGLLPVQYLAVVLTGHKLASGAMVATTETDGQTMATVDHGQDQPSEVTMVDPEPVAMVATTTAPEPPVTTAPPTMAKTTSTDPAVTMAIAAGIPRTTARRWADNGDGRLDKYRANGNGQVVAR